MNLTNILSSVGLGSGGEISSSRVFMFLILATALIPKIVLGVKGQPVVWDENDKWIIGMVLAGGIAKTVAENKTPEPKV